MLASTKALLKQNLYSQAITLSHIKFLRVCPVLLCFPLDSSSNRTPNKDFLEDDFPSSSRQLSKPKCAKPSGSHLYSPQSCSSPSSSSSTTANTIISNPFVGSMPFTPSLFLFCFALIAVDPLFFLPIPPLLPPIPCRLHPIATALTLFHHLLLSRFFPTPSFLIPCKTPCSPLFNPPCSPPCNPPCNPPCSPPFNPLSPLFLTRPTAILSPMSSAVT